MALSDYRLRFTKDWTNSADFPTYEGEETKVRADMQYLFDEIKTGFNNFVNALKASLVPFDATSAINASTVQGAIEEVQRQVAQQSQGQVPDGSITNAKLANGTIESGKIKAGAITTTQLADASVTKAKMAANSVDTSQLLNGSVTAAKLASDALNGKADLTDGRVSSSQNTKRSAEPTFTNAAYTLVVADANSVLRCANTADAVITIPANGTAELPIGTAIEIVQTAAGKITLAAASGVTLTGYTATVATSGVGSRLLLIKLNTNAWLASHIGGIEDGAVGTSKIANSAITTEKIAANAVSTDITTTIPGGSSGWTIWGNLVRRDITGITGLLSTDRVLMDLYSASSTQPSEDYALIALQTEFNKIIRATVTADGTIRVVAQSAPSTNIPVKLCCTRR